MSSRRDKYFSLRAGGISICRHGTVRIRTPSKTSSVTLLSNIDFASDRTQPGSTDKCRTDKLVDASTLRLQGNSPV